MSADWMIPDPDEAEFPPRHLHLPALPIGDQRLISYRVGHARLLPPVERGAAMARIAAEFGITPRTAYRYSRRSYPCPCPCCLTLVRGGGLCTFCRGHE